MFIRKVAPEFPDEILRHYIFNHDKDDLVLIEPMEMVYNRYFFIIKKYFYFLPVIIAFYMLYLVWYLYYITEFDT
jgi:hypothetical protein